MPNDTLPLSLDPVAKKNVEQWLIQDYDQTTKETIRKLAIEDSAELNSAFYTNLEFGTGGMRGVMGVGTNRMNAYTIGKATQGLANYINSQKIDSPSVLIGYDSREQSREFAEVAAKTLAGNGIKVYLFKELRPTPLVSFGCRFKKCTAAIMITASHNPPQYNGYKVYWDDGSQVLPPHDTGIIEEVTKIESLSQVHQSDFNNPLIEELLEDVDNAYVKAIEPLSLYKEEIKKNGHQLHILYTSLHGTGITLMPRVLKDWGFTHLSFVEKQIVPDGKFTYAPSPNPEEIKALQMGMDEMAYKRADILIATDPDADRVGVVCMHNGEAVRLNGNQVACLCLDHILKRRKHLGNLPKNAAFVKTITTTELFKKICDDNNVAMFDVLTGFKYVAEKIREWESEGGTYEYLFGGEESYGYLWGTETRDKDALTAGLLIAEIALVAKLDGKTLVDVRDEISRKYGLYYEALLTLSFPETKEGRDKMTHALDQLRKNPPKEINGIAVKTIDDYDIQLRLEVSSGAKSELKLAQSNVLVYWLNDGSKVMVRPSGTEPKVKFYCGVFTKSFTTPEAGLIGLTSKAAELLKSLEKHLNG